MEKILIKYCEILLDNIEKDQQMISNPWMIFTVIPLLLYIIFASIKWYFLLAPITVPFGFFGWGMTIQKLISKFQKKNEWILHALSRHSWCCHKQTLRRVGNTNLSWGGGRTTSSTPSPPKNEKFLYKNWF